MEGAAKSAVLRMDGTITTSPKRSTGPYWTLSMSPGSLGSNVARGVIRSGCCYISSCPPKNIFPLGGLVVFWIRSCGLSHHSLLGQAFTDGIVSGSTTSRDKQDGVGCKLHTRLTCALGNVNVNHAPGGSLLALDSVCFDAVFVVGTVT